MLRPAPGPVGGAGRMERERDATAIITGASRGLGLALATGLAGAGWELVVDARDAADLTAAAGRIRGGRASWRVPGDVTDPAHRRDLVAAADRLGGSTCWSTTPASSDRARSRPWPSYPLRRAARGVRGERRRAARADPARAAGAAVRAAARSSTSRSDAAVEAYAGLGRVRRGQGRDRAGWPRCSPRRSRRCGCGGRPGRPAHPDAPGGVPGRGHQRPAAAGRRSCPRSCGCSPTRRRPAASGSPIC